MRHYVGLLDLAVAGGATDRTAMIFSRPHYLEVGDRVHLDHETNRCRTRVVAIQASNSAEIKTFYRPSRGFARHNRRIKQEKRK